MPAKVKFNQPARENLLTNEMRRQRHFIPALVNNIRQAIFPSILQFNKNYLIFNNGIKETEYEDGKFIARSFLRAGIKKITLKEFLTQSEIKELEEILEAAQEGNILPLLPENIANLKVISTIEEITEKEEIAEIPGYYKHYTSYQGYLKIMQEQKIEAMPHQKNGEMREGVYLTNLSLTSEEAFKIVFIGNPQYRKQTTHVIAFDILDPQLKKEIKKNGIEFFLEKPINLNDSRIRLRYHGPNYLMESLA